jgi:hypothetical protein
MTSEKSSWARMGPAMLVGAHDGFSRVTTTAFPYLNCQPLYLRHKGYIYYSFFVPWCLSGGMEKVLPQKAQNLQLGK